MNIEEKLNSLILKSVKELRDKRKPKVVNLFKRIKVLSPDNIHVRNYSRKKPIAAFNPGAYYDSKTDDILIFPRLVFDYYWYVSSIGVFHFNINNSDQEVYETDIILWPKEIWEMAKGLEDPRVASFDQKFYFLHTSVSFNKQKSGILPLQGFTITDYNFNIIKKGYIKIKDGDEIYIPQSFKDSALIDFKKGEFSSLLRPTINGVEINWFGKINEDTLEVNIDTLKPVLVMEEWEDKVGWSTNTVKLGKDEYLVGWHGVGKEDIVYRNGLAIVSSSGDLLGITDYLLEPRDVYEFYGDRPGVIFGCGLILRKDELYWIGGLSDYGIGIYTTELPKILENIRWIIRS